MNSRLRVSGYCGVDYMRILQYTYNMPRTREHSLPTRQIYASIREDIYLAAKKRTAELQIPMRRFIEDALAMAIAAADTDDGARLIDDAAASEAQRQPPSLWDEQRIGAQVRRPLGAPVDLPDDDARRLALGAFPASSAEPPGSVQERLDCQIQVSGDVGDPVDISDEDAVRAAIGAFDFGTYAAPEEMRSG